LPDFSFLLCFYGKTPADPSSPQVLSTPIMEPYPHRDTPAAALFWNSFLLQSVEDFPLFFLLVLSPLVGRAYGRFSQSPIMLLFSMLPGSVSLLFLFLNFCRPDNNRSEFYIPQLICTVFQSGL